MIYNLIPAVWFHAVRWWWGWWRVIYDSQLCIWSRCANHSRSAQCCMYIWCYFQLTTKAIFAQHLNFIHKMYESYLYQSLWQDWSPVAEKCVNNLWQQQTDGVTATMILVNLFLNEPQSSFIALSCITFYCYRFRWAEWQVWRFIWCLSVVWDQWYQGCPRKICDMTVE